MAKFMLSLLLEQLCFALNIPELSTQQIAYIANTLVSEFWYLKLEDFALCFKNGKLGLYGKLYNRLDIAIICEWLRTYEADKTAYTEQKRMEENRLAKLQIKDNDYIDGLSFILKSITIDDETPYKSEAQMALEQAEHLKKIEEQRKLVEQGLI